MEEHDRRNLITRAALIRASAAETCELIRRGRDTRPGPCERMEERVEREHRRAVGRQRAAEF